ncbi:MAG: adenylate/guanylate cyclase domain-containing protein [Pseudomonadota bacterium]
MQHRLAAILAADVVGYSRLVGQDEIGTLAAVKALQEDFIEPLIESHRGRIFSVMGDGFLVEFGSAIDAVKAALAWQQGLAERADDGNRLTFRIGVNLGDLVAEEDEIRGHGINVAVRLESIAEPGSICIADTVRQAIAGQITARFSDLGDQQLKNIAKPIRVWQWRSNEADAANGRTESQTPAFDQLSIAVLPFDDMSSDPEQAFFCDGMTEDLITELAHIRGLTVIARHSSFAYKGQSLDARRIGSELGVRHLVEGSVRRSGNRVRITAQLIDAKSGGHLWAQRYDRDIDDIFAVQDDVVRHIADALPGALGHRVQTETLGPHPGNLAAYEFVMRGRQNILRAQGRGEVKKDLQAAIALDPNLSDAYAWLAVYYYTDWFQYHHEDRRESMAAGFSAADKAIETSPENSLAHMALGMVNLYAGRRAIALESLRHSLSLNPNNADAHCLIQDAYTFEGDPQAGVDSVRTAMRLNPHYPEWYLWHLGFALYCVGDYQSAVDTLNKLEDIVEPVRILAAAHARLGNKDEADRAAKRFLSAFPDFSAAGWGDTQPFKNKCELDHVLEGYRLAGLPG